MDPRHLSTDSTPSPVAQDQVHARDPHAFLRADMRVKGEQGKSLGRVEHVEHDGAGVLTGIADTGCR